MSKLELLGALFAQSVMNRDVRNDKLMLLVEQAKDEITDEIEAAQFALWKSLGKPSFEVSQ